MALLFHADKKIGMFMSDKYSKTMLESRPEDALVKLVKTVETVENGINHPTHRDVV